VVTSIQVKDTGSSIQRLNAPNRPSLAVTTTRPDDQGL